MVYRPTYNQAETGGKPGRSVEETPATLLIAHLAADHQGSNAIRIFFIHLNVATGAEAIGRNGWPIAMRENMPKWWSWPTIAAEDTSYFKRLELVMAASLRILGPDWTFVRTWLIREERLHLPDRCFQVQGNMKGKPKLNENPKDEKSSDVGTEFRHTLCAKLK